MIRVKRDVPGRAVAVDQQQDFAVLSYGAFASREHDLPHVQSDVGIELYWAYSGSLLVWLMK